MSDNIALSVSSIAASVSAVAAPVVHAKALSDASGQSSTKKRKRDESDDEEAVPALTKATLTPSHFHDGVTEDNMSADNGVKAKADRAGTTLRCAACGVAANDNVKLAQCPKCDLVHYCGDECKDNHREQHETACKKRAAELHDELLFKHPEGSHRGDCPICFLPLPIGHLDKDCNHIPFECCSKEICKGCLYAYWPLQILEEEEEPTVSCPMCRTALPKDDEEKLTYMMKRVAVNDPVAMREVGKYYYKEKDNDKAFEFLSRAAKLGDATACLMLAQMYRRGEGVEKDYEREVHFLEIAAIAGHPSARHALARHEWDERRYDRAVKHWIISTHQGCRESLKSLDHAYKEGHVSKDDFAAALRAHKAALDEMRSPQRNRT